MEKTIPKVSAKNYLNKINVLLYERVTIYLIKKFFSVLKYPF